jgi:hypothetical protein
MAQTPESKFWNVDYIRKSRNLFGKNAENLRGVFHKLGINDNEQLILNNDTLIDKAISEGIISAETYEVRRKLFDKVEGFKLWRDIGMSIGNTVKTILPNAWWIRGLVEQGQHLGYAGIEAQCKYAITNFEEKQFSCSYCGYSETVEQRQRTESEGHKGDGLECAIFSCEHIIELGAMFLITGIMIGEAKNSGDLKYFQELYRSNYEMACCRCNFIKSDIQVNKSIVPASEKGEPTIFVGWNPASKEFYVNTKAITEFARLVMCFDVRVNGMKGYRNMQTYLSLLGGGGGIDKAIKIIFNNTVKCVQTCVNNLNNKIVKITPSTKLSDNELKLKMFNPLVLRLCLYAKIFNLQNKPTTGGRNSSYSNMVGGAGWWSSVMDTICQFFEKDTKFKFFDNSIGLDKDIYRCFKISLMGTLDDLLESSLEYQIYKNAAEYYSLSNEQRQRGINTAVSFDGLVTKSREKFNHDITTTTNYVNLFYNVNTTIQAIFPDNFESSPNGKLDDIFDKINEILNKDSLSELETSLYIDVWNILNDYITRIYKIINFDIIDIIDSLQSHPDINRIRNLLNVVKTCLMKGLYHVLFSLFKYTGELFIRKKTHANGFYYIFYEVNNVYFGVNTQNNKIKAIYIIEFDTSIFVDVNNRHDCLKITEVADITVKVTYFDNDPVPGLTQNNLVINPASSTAEAVAAAEAAAAAATAAAAGAEAAEAEADAIGEAARAAASEPIAARTRAKTKAAAAAAAAAVKAAARVQVLFAPAITRAKTARDERAAARAAARAAIGGSNVGNNFIYGIPSKIRNMKNSKSLYKISKTRSTLFDKSKLKRKMRSMKLKPRKNRTLRKKHK